MVGCVVVSDGVVVGEGFHLVAGGPHAEVVALEQAGEKARGATAYVTLEPCNHFGRTPPCAARLASAGIARVVIGMPDPNPEVTGGGADALRAAGIAIEYAVDPAPYECQNEAWLKRLRTGLPWVTAKVALSLDGHAAVRGGHRSRITGPGAAKATMRLREASTAIAVGASTVAIDDPLLTVRGADENPLSRQPRRLVISRTSVPLSSAALFSDAAAPAMLVTSDLASHVALSALSRAGVPYITYPADAGLRAALAAIAEDGIDDVLIEAGPGLLSALWRERLVDELVLLHAGGMAGGTAPALLLGSADTSGFDLAPTMSVVEVGIAGEDAVTIWRPSGQAGRSACRQREETRGLDVHWADRV
jgi:diaminohydroxyphosphoribosylaminopyrimidine deaminase/5-amino-6-(5-phosphoribosylamino)uracil reductase